MKDRKDGNKGKFFQTVVVISNLPLTSIKLDNLKKHIEENFPELELRFTFSCYDDYRLQYRVLKLWKLIVWLGLGTDRKTFWPIGKWHLNWGDYRIW